MHLEFLSDRKSFMLILTALSAQAILSALFVYPRGVARRLFAVRALVLILFFLAAISVTLIYPAATSKDFTLFVLVDRSVSMDRALSTADARVPSALASDALARLDAACDSIGADLKTLYFSEEVSEHSGQIGRRTTTEFAPALSRLLDLSSGGARGPGPARAILISDGAAADEPMIEPFLTALFTRGIPVDVLSWEDAQAGAAPRIFFRVPPPGLATAGDSVLLEIGLVSASPARLTVSEGSASVAEYQIKDPAVVPPIHVIPKSTGLRTFVLSAENDFGSSRAQFRMKVIPRLVFELTGQPSWDARFFLVTASGRPGVTVRGRWESPAPSATSANVVTVVFGGRESLVSPKTPVIFWAQSEMSGENLGIRWLGRQSGPFLPARIASLPAASQLRLPPLAARQKVLLDLGWNVIERYTDDAVFLAERRDTGVTPAFLVNGEGLWRWWVNSAVRSDDPLSASSPAYESLVDRLIQWGRQSTLPAADLFVLQEAGQIGSPVELVALFSSVPAAPPPLTIIGSDGKEEQLYGVGTTAIRYSYVPRRPGSYRAVLQTASGVPATASFEISDAPFDLAHTEPRPDLLRHIAARTGGRVLSSSKDREGPSVRAEELISEIETLQLAPIRTDERRIHLAQTPAFFIALIALLSLLWTLESKWIR